MRYNLKPSWTSQLPVRLARHTIIVPLLVCLTMFGFIFLAWRMIPPSDNESLKAETRSNLANFSAQLEAHIMTRLAIGEQLTNELENGHINSKAAFLLEAKSTYELFSDFQAINWVDRHGIIRWVVPLKGNEEVQDLNVKTLAAPSFALAEAERTGHLQITTPITLTQGGIGFVAYIPVLKKAKITGFIDIVFRTEPLVKSALRDGILGRYDLKITDGPDLLYQTTENPTGAEKGFDKEIRVANRSWKIIVMPTASTINAHSSIVDELVLIILLVLTAAISVLIHLAMKHQQKQYATDKLFRTFIEHSPSAIIIKDAKGRYLHANTRWHEWFNPQGLDISGKALEDFFSEKHAREIAAQEALVVSQKEPVEKEYMSSLSEGKFFPSLLQKFPIMNDFGDVIAIGGVNTDISANKKTEENLRIALIKAEEANQAKSKFLATMSHELRTPLNAIIGFSDILASQYFGPLGNKKYKEYAKDINHSGTHLLALINEVLDISAIELGKRQLVQQPIILSAVLNDCIKSVKHRARLQGILVKMEAEADLPIILADETAFRQIFLNLLANSIKFSGTGDTVTLTVCARREDVAITVADTGKGIRQEQLSTITQPFVKGHSDSHTTSEGVGLGLSIVKSFVDAQNGTLTIDSELGKGTTVTVTFPRRQEQMVA